MENPIIEKLRKLIAHEKSARSIGNLKEAEAFADKIQQLLDEHKLSMSEVEFEAREESEPIEWEKFDPVTEGFDCSRLRRIPWQIKLARGIARSNTCDIVIASNGSSIYFVGRTSDREICRSVFTSLLELGYRLSALCMQYDYINEAVKCAEADGNFRAWMRDYRRSWLLGFAQAVSARLYDAHKARMAGLPSSSTAMVHISKDLALIAKAIKDGGASEVTQRSRSGRNTEAFQRGRSAGAAVNLSPGRLKKSSTLLLNS